MWNLPSRHSAIHILVVSALMAGLSFGACKKEPKPLAELIEVLDGALTKRSNQVGEWAAALKGDTFKNGDELRTNDTGKARVRIQSETLRMGAGTTLHFGGKKIEFYGEIFVDEGFEELGLDFGDATITTTGQLRIVQRGDRLEFEVLVGEATITQRGETSVLQLGDELAFELGDLIEKIEEPPIDAGIPDDAAIVVPDAAPLSVLIQATISGKGVRMRDAEGGKWTKLKPGKHEIPSNSEIDVKRRSRVLLVRGNDRVSIAGASLAFVNEQSDEFVMLKKGRIEAHAEAAQLVVAVPGGAVELHADQELATNTVIQVGPKGTAAEVSTGKATLRSGDRSEVIGMGESARMHKGKIEVVDKAPTFSHITLGTVADATLHVVKSPVNVRIKFSSSCARAVVEVARGRNFARPAQRRAGKGNAIIVLGNGSHRYRVRCYQGDTLSAKPAVSGRLSVRRDSGSRPLPKGAPINTIDADGRRYTVLYQNRLPAITFRWRKAPAARKYTLNIVAQRGKTRTLSSPKAEKSFKPGAFTEGEYEYWFAAAGKESKRSKLKISFDNAAATGYLSSPRPKGKLTGATTQVTGAAVLGWSVSVAGKTLALDKQYRFDEEVPLAGDGVAIRFSHPKYGNHYYVRSR